MITYDIKIPDDSHWDALCEELDKINSQQIYPDDIDSYLEKYNGITYFDESFIELRVIKGIKFKTEEDLVYFKLRF